MIEITIFESPFDAQLQTVVAANAGDTVAEFLAATGVAERMRREPIVVRHAGNDLLRAEYETVLVSNEISLHVLPQGGSELLWYGLSTLIISAVVNYYMQDQLDSNSNPERSPTYDINSRGNAARLGAPKPVFYGRMRTYPDLGALPYTEFDANGDQLLYQLFEVRQGECVIDVADMRFEDTPLASFEGYEVEVIAPGERSTIYPGQVVVSSELSSIEIGPTPNDYGSFKEMKHNVDSAPDASYYACDIGQTITRIALDIVAPNGIWRSNDEGKIRFRQVGVRLEARKVDDANQPIGGWFPLGNIVLASDAQNYRNAVRKTFSYAVEAARYEVRTVRTTTKTDTHYVSDTLNWVGLRGYTGDALPAVTTTRIALKIRASEQLSDRGAGKFNVISTGKIPVWSPFTGWSAPQVTASPAWAFADILRNQTYGSTRGDAYIDLQGLYARAQEYAASGIEFHGGFDTETTVWDALKKVAAVGQAVPVDRAGVYYMVPDVEASVPAFMFTHSNIVKDSFRIDYSSVVEETVDAYRVTFLDKNQAYRETSFICALPGSAQEKIKDIKLFGCVDHDQAFNWGMYLLASGFYRRQRVEFQTGIEGYLPFYGDTVAVSHYLIGREGQQQVSGDVVAFDGVDVLTLGEDIPALTSPHIILRGLDGSLSDAYAVTVLNGTQVQITEAFDSSVLVFESGYERPHFMLGEGAEFFARVKIDSIKSAGNNVYTISGFVDAPEVYDAAAGLPLPPVTELPPVLDLAPVISNLRAVLSGDVNTPQVLLRWDSKNADYFIVHTSADNGVTWAPIATRLVDNFLTHAALVGAIKYRVSGVNFLQGQWVEVAVNTGEPSFVAPAPVTGLALSEAFTGTELRFQWASDYTHHKVAFYLGGVEKLAVDVVGEVFSYSLSAASARANGLGRSFTVRVWSVSQYGKLSATSTDLAVSNPLPGALDNLAVTLSLGTVFVTYDLPTYADFDGVSIWVSTENNFTPSNANRVADRIRDKSFSFEMPDTLLYVRVAALDVWGDDYFVSGQYTLDPVDLFERLTGEILESHLHQSLLEPIQLINAPGGLVSQIEQNTQNISTEIQNRAQALLDEANERNAAILAESSARALALQQEALARGAAITAVENAQQTVNDSVATQLTTVTAATNANTAGLQTEITTRTNQVNSLSQQMSTLTAGTNSQFDHAVIWYFDDGIEGWTGNGAPTIANPGWLRPSNDLTDPRVFSPAGLGIDGTMFTQVRLRIRKVGNPPWAGLLRWTYVGDVTFNNTKMLAAAEPSYAEGTANLTFNVDSQYWSGKTITQLRLDLSDSQTSTDYFEIDWVAVGRPSPGASSAELSELQQTVTDNYSALSQSITNTNATVANKADTSAVNALGSRVTATENSLQTQSDLTTALRASLLNSASLPVDFANGFSDWTLVRHGAPSAISTATGSLIADNDLGSSADVVFASQGANILTKGVVRVLPGRIYEVRIRFKVLVSDGSVGFTVVSAMMPADYSSSLSPNFVNGIGALVVTTTGTVVEMVSKFSTASASGITALNAATVFMRYGLRLNTADTNVTVRVGRITCDDITAVSANSAATALLDARVTQTEQSVVSQSSSIVSLQDSVSDAQFDIVAAQAAADDAATLAGSKGKVIIQSAAPAVADRLPQNLWIDITTNANTPKRWNGTAWVAVTDKVATDAAAAAASALSGLGSKADASALTALTNRVTATENSITTQSTQYTNLRNSLNPNGINENPTFDDWTGLMPAGWSAQGSAQLLAKHTGAYAYSGGAALQVATTDATASGVAYTVPSSKAADAEWLDIEIVFTVTSGSSLAGAGMLIDWVMTDATYVRVAVNLAAIYPAGTFQLNKKIICTARVKKPASAKIFSNHRLYLFGSYTGSGLGPAVAKTIIFDSVRVVKADASSEAIELLDSRVEDTEDGLLIQSQKTTSLEASRNSLELMQWSRDYAVTSSAAQPLLTATGAALPINSGGTGNTSSFIATGVAVGNTGYDTQTIARFEYVGSAWTVTQLSNKGQTGANPIFLISGGVPSVTIALTATYNIRVTLENERLKGGSGTANAKATETLSATVNDSANGVVATSGKVVALQNALGGATAGAFTTLKSQVENGSTGLAATASKVDQVQATMPGGGNLIPTDTEFSSDLAGWSLGGNTTGKTVNLARLTSDADAWRVKGANNLQLSVSGAQTNGAYFEIQLPNNQIPVEVGKRYCFSAYAAAHRCTGNLMIWWINSAGALINAYSGGNITASGGQVLSAWARSATAVFGIAPPNAVYARLVYRVTTTTAADPFTWLCKPMFSEVPATTSVPPAYSPSGATATIAAVKVTAEAAANDAGEAVARWEVKTTVGDLTGGVGFWNDGIKTRFAVHADQFYIFSPGKNSLTMVIDGDDIVFPGGKIQTNTVTANKLNVTELSAITANLGMVTAGTFQTSSGTGLRVTISSSGSYPLWIGSGALVNDANGALYVKNDGTMVYKGQLNIKSATSGQRTEIDNRSMRVYGASNNLLVRIGEWD